MSQPPAWYPDPQDSALMRWWDGHAWTNDTRPAAEHPVDTAAPMTPRPSSLPGSPSPALSRGGIVMLVVSLICCALTGALLIVARSNQEAINTQELTLHPLRVLEESLTTERDKVNKKLQMVSELEEYHQQHPGTNEKQEGQ